MRLPRCPCRCLPWARALATRRVLVVEPLRIRRGRRVGQERGVCVRRRVRRLLCLLRVLCLALAVLYVPVRMRTTGTHTTEIVTKVERRTSRVAMVPRMGLASMRLRVTVSAEQSP